MINIWELSNDVLHVDWKWLSSVGYRILQMVLWTVAAAVWPCFCSLFLLFLLSLSTSHSNFICKELLQVIAALLTLLQSNTSKIYFYVACREFAGNMQEETMTNSSANRNVWTSGEKCALCCVYPCVFTPQNTHHFRSRCGLSLSSCTILHHLLIPLGC